MNSFKLNSQPFHPSEKSKYFHKKEENSNSTKVNETKNEMKKENERKERKVIKITTVYCSNYLKMFKDNYTDLPSNCSVEKLHYIERTQQQISSSLNEEMKLNNNNNQNNIQKKESFSSQSNTTQLSSKQKSDSIELLIPISKPIPRHHPSLLSSSSFSTKSISSTSNEDFPDLLVKSSHKNHFDTFDKRKQLQQLDEINEIQEDEDNRDNEEEENDRETIISQKRRIAREKQIFFGKNTREYSNYLLVIPKDQRLISDPKTPDIESSLSKRKWDRIVRRWRRSLHAFDNVNQQNQVELARALSFRLRNEHDPKKTMLVYSSLPYSSYLIDE